MNPMRKLNCIQVVSKASKQLFQSSVSTIHSDRYRNATVTCAGLTTLINRNTQSMDTMEKSVLRWGICGAGMICNDFCSALLSPKEQDRKHKLVAIGARSKESAEKFAGTFGIPKAYGTYQEIADDPDIEVVYIGVVHPEHVRLSRMMLEAGKHVLCEKPLAESWEECRKVIDFAREKKLLLVEAVWSRFFPVYEAIKKDIKSGNLGEVNMVTAQLCKPNISERKTNRKDLMGGILLLLGIYPVQFVMHVYGEMPEKIIAVGSLNEEGVDEDGCITMLFSRNRKASVIYSGKAAGGHNSATIRGTKGKIHIDESFWCPSEAILTTGLVVNKKPEGPVPYVYENSGGLIHEADHVYELIRNGLLDSPIYGYKDVEMVHRIMDEIMNQIGLKYH